MATQHPSYVSVNVAIEASQDFCDQNLYWLEPSRGIGGRPNVIKADKVKGDKMLVKLDSPTAGSNKTGTAQVAGLCTLSYKTAAEAMENREKYEIKNNYSTLPTELVFVLEHLA